MFTQSRRIGTCWDWATMRSPTWKLSKSQPWFTTTDKRSHGWTWHSRGLDLSGPSMWITPMSLLGSVTFWTERSLLSSSLANWWTAATFFACTSLLGKTVHVSCVQDIHVRRLRSRNNGNAWMGAISGDFIAGCTSKLNEPLICRVGVRMWKLEAGTGHAKSSSYSPNVKGSVEARSSH